MKNKWISYVVFFIVGYGFGYVFIPGRDAAPKLGGGRGGAPGPGGGRGGDGGSGGSPAQAGESVHALAGGGGVTLSTDMRPLMVQRDPETGAVEIYRKGKDGKWHMELPSNYSQSKKRKP